MLVLHSVKSDVTAVLFTLDKRKLDHSKNNHTGYLETAEELAGSTLPKERDQLGV